MPALRGVIVSRHLRFAVRALRATPIVTVVALATLALGIGANAAIFSFINALLLAPLPYPHADRLVSLWEQAPSGRRNAMAALNYFDYAESGVFEKVAATTGCCGAVVLGTDAQPVSVFALHVSASYFDVLGAHASIGRTFMPGEDQPGRDRVVVLSHKFWSSQFGADRSMLDRSIRLNGESYTVVGVMPADGPFDRAWTQMWLPQSFPPERINRANDWLLSLTGPAVGLLKPGITVARAQRELDAIAARLGVTYPETNGSWGVVVEPYASVLVSDDLKRLLLLLMAAVGFVLLIGCVNLANVMLAGGLAREREIAIRRALGASRGDLIRQFLAESLLLSTAGGLLGVAWAYVMVAILKAAVIGQPLNPSFVPYLLPAEASIQVDGPVLGFTFVVSVLSGVGFGLVPAIRSTRQITETSAGLYRPSIAGGTRHRLERALVVNELALVFLLLIGAGLLMRSLVNMQNADKGFSATNVLTVELPIWERRFANDEGLRAYLRQIRSAIERVPGVVDVALTDGLPLQGVPNGQFFQVVGRPIVDRARRPICDFTVVSPSYFRAMGLRMRRGRALLESDREGTPYVTVINETLARKYFSDSDPVGQQLLMEGVQPGASGDVPWTIVGVTNDERLTPFDDRREHPAVYVPIDQSPTILAGVVVRTAGDPQHMRESIRHAVTTVDKDQAINNVRTVGQLETDALAPNRLRTWFLGLFGTVALVLSAVGVYGVFGYAVVRRSREIGIRAALGARRRHLIWLILREGMASTALGLALGLVATLVVMRLLRSFLFGVSAADPVALGGAAAAVAGLACYIPARHAATIEPVSALRAE